MTVPAIALVHPITGDVFQPTPSITVVSPPVTLPAGFVATCRTLTGAITVSAPPTPAVGDAFAVSDVDRDSAANPITVNGNGHAIDGGPTATVNVNGADGTWIFTGSGAFQGWKKAQSVSRLVPLTSGPVGNPFGIGADLSAGPPGPPGPPGPAGSPGFVPATLLGPGGIFDFSAQPNQTIAADGAVVLGGLAFLKRNSANEAPAPAQHMKIVNGSGLVIQPGRVGGATATDYGAGLILGGAANSAPMLCLSFPQIIPAGVGWPSAFQVELDLAADTMNAALASEAFTLVGIDNGIVNTDGGNPYFAGFAGMALTGTGVVNNRSFFAGTRRGAVNVDSLAAVQAVQTLALQTDRLGGGLPATFTLYSGVASFPTDDQLIPEVTTSQTVINTWRGQAPTSTMGLFLSIAAGTQTENALYVTTIKRVKVAYRL